MRTAIRKSAVQDLPFSSETGSVICISAGQPTGHQSDPFITPVVTLVLTKCSGSFQPLNASHAMRARCPADLWRQSRGRWAKPPVVRHARSNILAELRTTAPGFRLQLQHLLRLTALITTSLSCKMICPVYPPWISCRICRVRNMYRCKDLSRASSCWVLNKLLSDIAPSQGRIALGKLMVSKICRRCRPIHGCTKDCRSNHPLCTAQPLCSCISSDTVEPCRQSPARLP